MSGALAHLEEGRGGTAHTATVLLWDAASTGVPLPPVPWRTSELDDAGQSRGYRVRGWDDVSASTRSTTRTTARSRSSTPRPAPPSTPRWTRARCPPYERAAPLRAALHWSLSEPGRHLLHAGAVGRGRRWLCCGGRQERLGQVHARPSPAWRPGSAYLGDDYVLVGGPGLRAHHARRPLDRQGGCAWASPGCRRSSGEFLAMRRGGRRQGRARPPWP